MASGLSARSGFMTCATLYLFLKLSNHSNKFISFQNIYNDHRNLFCDDCARTTREATSFFHGASTSLRYVPPTHEPVLLHVAKQHSKHKTLLSTTHSLPRYTRKKFLVLAFINNNNNNRYTRNLPT